MELARTIEEVRTHVAAARRAGQRVGCVPTMGALHAGHLSLIERARAECDAVVVTIFVNRTQFVAGEDFEAYPRTFDADLRECERAGVDLVFAPTAEEIYGPDPLTQVRVSGRTEGLCGPHRPGHFDGVTTVVAILFNIVQPDAAFFGQKDAQQAVAVRKMAADLHFPVAVVVCETVREPDGLALSSRNAYLSADERRQALSLPQALRLAQERIDAGERDAAALAAAIRSHIAAAGPCTIDYVEVVHADTLAPRTRVAGRTLIALAVRIGRARLIDNLVVDVPAEAD